MKFSYPARLIDRTVHEGDGFLRAVFSADPDKPLHEILEMLRLQRFEVLEGAPPEVDLRELVVARVVALSEVRNLKTAPGVYVSEVEVDAAGAHTDVRVLRRIKAGRRPREAMVQRLAAFYEIEQPGRDASFWAGWDTTYPEIVDSVFDEMFSNGQFPEMKSATEAKVVYEKFFNAYCRRVERYGFTIAELRAQRWQDTPITIGNVRVWRSRAVARAKKRFGPLWTAPVTPQLRH